MNEMQVSLTIHKNNATLQKNYLYNLTYEVTLLLSKKKNQKNDKKEKKDKTAKDRKKTEKKG